MASFRNIYTALMLFIARSTEKELARQVRYLKAEIHILRSRLTGKISFTEGQKNSLVRFAKKLGSALNELVTIVHPGTIRRFILQSWSKTASRSKETSGRPQTAQDIEKLIQQLANETGWVTVGF